MQVKRLSAALIAAAMLSGAGGLAFAQQPSAKPAPQMPGGDQRSMDHGGMMGGSGMMGGMMGGGQRAMDHRGMMGRMMMVPQMPPGNEKLQFQMQAEMMQKMGEVAAKYAERIKEEPRSAPR
ncbi:MAG TPA: hypothetical protein VMN03_12585 [Burkholderiales bacterium]|nr:hypothetical protein [Burkholderiales bacterium]